MTDKNPWKILSTREIYSNPWITVREDQVLTPGGTPGIYGVVKDPDCNRGGRVNA